MVNGAAEQTLSALEAAVAASDWDACADACFLLLHGLAPGAARDVAARALARAWRILAASRPELSWPSDLLSAPSDWLPSGVPEWPEPAYPGEVELTTGLDALLAGLGNPERLPTTAAYAAAVVLATSAEATRAWAEHDAEAYRAWSGLEDFGEDDEALALLTGRTVLDDAAADAVRRASWAAVAADLRAVGTLELDLAEAQAALALWIEHERLAFLG